MRTSSPYRLISVFSFDAFLFNFNIYLRIKGKLLKKKTPKKAETTIEVNIF